MSLDDSEYLFRQHAFLRDAILPILPFLQDGTVSDIMLNDDGRVWIDQDGKAVETGVSLSPPKALAILRAVAGQADRELTFANPSLDAELRPWGARVKAAIPPITRAPVFTMRKPPGRVFSLDEYVAAGIMSADAAGVLRAAVASKQNILVSGATGSGKTTFVNALIAEMARGDDRLFIAEDVPELRCSSPNRVQYYVQPPFSMRLAIMDALRSRPDRIIVGEVRDGAAALELVKAWNTGHPGGTGTIHSNDNRQALNRLCQLIEEVAERAPREIIAETVNVCVHIRPDPRLAARRRIAGLHFVRGLKGDGSWDLVPLKDADHLAELVTSKTLAFLGEEVVP
jgi:type IV secretion system protein VirB11